VLVARDARQVVAFCHFGEGRGPELYRMYVLPSYWRQGIGARFVALMEDEWRARGVTEYFCYVHGRNEIGKAFYLKHGFVHAPERDTEDGRCMVKRHGDRWYNKRRGETRKEGGGYGTG
jgi:GNAT superfamily N-acetyltransferase